MKQSRRDFLKSSLGAISVLGFSLYKLPDGAKECHAAESIPIAEIPVIWMATGSCSGCSVSLLNTGGPTIQALILREVVPNLKLWIGFHSTLMAASGESAMQAMEKIIQEKSGEYVLVVDGATATKDNGIYCAIGEENQKAITGMEHVTNLGKSAMAVLAVGACAAFGGIPAAPPNPTEAKSVMELFSEQGIQTPVVNIPGCPSHPDWIVGTIATLMHGGLESLKLDEHNRPTSFFSTLIHDNCPYRGQFDKGKFAQRFGEHGCLIKLGCKGPMTHADCPIRRWNNGTNWCVQAGHPCIGCTEPEFPFKQSMFNPVKPAMMTYPGTYPPTAVSTSQENEKDKYVALGLIGTAGFLAGVGVTAAANKMQSQSAKTEDESTVN